MSRVHTVIIVAIAAGILAAIVAAWTLRAGGHGGPVYSVLGEEAIYHIDNRSGGYRTSGVSRSELEKIFANYILNFDSVSDVDISGGVLDKFAFRLSLSFSPDLEIWRERAVADGVVEPEWSLPSENAGRFSLSASLFRGARVHLDSMRLEPIAVSDIPKLMEPSKPGTTVIRSSFLPLGLRYPVPAPSDDAVKLSYMTYAKLEGDRRPSTPCEVVMVLTRSSRDGQWKPYMQFVYFDARVHGRGVPLPWF